MNVAVVGCGSISKFHFPGFEKAGAKIAWVCDLSEEAAGPWAERYGAKYTADFREAVTDPAVDVVDVTTISSLHREIAMEAINAGKALIVEKTLTESAADSLAVVRRAEERKTLFYTSYMKRFIPAVQKAKELLPSLGRVVSTSIRAYQPWGNMWEGSPGNEFFRVPKGGMSEVRRRYGGGILVCGGSHILDLVGFFLGRPRRLYASVHTPEGSDLDVQAAALLETENGIVHYEALAHPLQRIGFLNDGWDERIEINGTGGRLEIYSALWDQPYHKASKLVHYDNGTGNALEYRFPPVSPFERAISFYCGNIEKGVQGSQSIYTGYDVDVLIDAIGRSSGNGAAVEVDWRAG